MTELMVNGFEIDGYADHEMSIFHRPEEAFAVFCSKWPHDIDVMGPLLRIDHDLWVIFMLRDPRDVIVSRHQQDPTVYWTNLQLWKRYTKFAHKLAGHPRFVTVRYEDLVREPDRVQDTIERKMPFLHRRSAFTEYHRVARPSGRSANALRGVRPLDTRSIGRWRDHKPRLAAQLQLHGSIVQELISYGYEPDDDWLVELTGVEPDHFESKHVERQPLEQMRRRWHRYKNIVRYVLGRSRRVDVGGRWRAAAGDE